MLGEGDAELALGGGQFGGVEGADVALVVVDLALANPLAEAVEEEGIVEVLGPDGAELDARLAQAAVEVEHSDQAGPLSTPVGDGEDGAAMADEACEDVVAVLPDGLDDDEGGVGVDGGEDIHTHALVEDKAVLEVVAVGMGAADLEALGGEGLDDGALGLGLGGPADLVGRLTQIAAGDEKDFAGDGCDGGIDFRNGIR
jgi:hypothetical protein